jgi:hypothetical protein
MNITFDISGLKQLSAELVGFSDRRLAAAVATGMTRTAVAIRKDWRDQLQSRFDRPERLTSGAPVSTMATAQKLEATVRLSDLSRGRAGVAPQDYIGTHELGGTRLVKKFERALQSKGAMPVGYKAVPGQYADLDGFGNVSRGQIVRVLAQLGGDFSPGYAQVIKRNAPARAAAAKRWGRDYVAISKPVGRLAAGIYQRLGDDLLPVFFFVPQVSYRRRLSLMDDARRLAGSRLGAEVGKAIAESLTRLRSRQGQP